MTDQWAPYKNAFGFSPERNFPGTLMRFPLRTSEHPPSVICQRFFDEENMKNHIEEIWEESRELLLFLHHVTSLELYTWSDGESQPTLLHSVCVESREDVFAKLRTKDDISKLSESINEVIIHDTVVTRSDGSTTNWMIASKMGSSETLQFIQSHPAAKLVPWASVALRMSEFQHGLPVSNPFHGRIFSLLPLHATNNLPVHVNGCFQLGSDRRDLMTDGRGEGKDKVEWNQCLIETVLAPAYVTLVKNLQVRVASQGEVGADIVYSFFPCLEKSLGVWNSLARGFYAGLIKERHPVMFSLNQNWLPVLSVYFCSDSLSEPVKEYIKVEKICELVVVNPPLKDLLLCAESSHPFNHFNSTSLRQLLRNIPVAFENVETLLSYCVDDGEDMQDLFLIPLMNRGVGKFSRRKGPANGSLGDGMYLLGSEAATAIFETELSEFLCLSSLLLRYWNSLPGWNIVTLNSKNVAECLSRVLPIDWKKQNIIQELGERELNVLQRLWIYLGNTEEAAFADFSQWPITLTVTNQAIKFNKSNKCFQYDPSLYPIVELLSKLSIYVLSDKISARKVSSLTISYSLDNLITHLHGKKTEIAQLLCPQEKRQLFNYFSAAVARKADCTNKNFLMQLPIWEICGDNFSAINVKEFFIPPEAHIRCNQKKYLVIDSVEHHQFIRFIGVKTQNLHKYYQDAISNFLSSPGDQDVAQVMKKVLSSMALEKSFLEWFSKQNFRFLPSSSGLKCASEFFSPDERVIELLQGFDDIFPPLEFREDEVIMGILRSVGLQKHLTFPIYQTIIPRLAEAADPKLSKKFLIYLEGICGSKKMEGLSVEEKPKLINLLNDTAWCPSLKFPYLPSKAIPSYYQRSNGQRNGLDKPRIFGLIEHKHLLGSVKPIMHPNFPNVVKFLGMKSSALRPDDVIENLQIICQTKLPIAELQEACQEIYKFLGGVNLTKKHLAQFCSFSSILLPEQNCFVRPNQLVVKDWGATELNLAPSYYAMPEYMENLKDKLGIKVLPTSVKYDLLRNIKSLSPEDLQKCLYVAQVLSNASDEVNLEELYLPNNEGRMVLASTLLSGGARIHPSRVIHNIISSDIACRLGIQTLQDTLGKAYDRGENLCQIIDDALVNVKPIQFLYELLQNSDDAQSKNFSVYFDMESYSATQSLYHPDMREFQGQAIFTSNDSVFSEEDFEGFLHVRKSVKKRSNWKIGRYGAGMMSVFHITDFPSFISGDFYCMHDPNCHFFTSNTFRVAVDQPEFASNIEPFKHLPNFRGNRGTIFRLPIRRSRTTLKSGITKASCYTNDELLWNIILDFTEDIPSILPLLNHTERIQIFRKDVGQTQFTKTHQYSISPEEAVARKTLATSNRPPESNRRCTVVQEGGPSYHWVISQNYKKEAFEKGDSPAMRLATVMKCISPLNFAMPHRIMSYLPLPLYDKFPFILSAGFALEPDRHRLAEHGSKTNTQMNNMLLDAYKRLCEELWMIDREAFWDVLPTGQFDWSKLAMSMRMNFIEILNKKYTSRKLVLAERGHFLTNKTRIESYAAELGLIPEIRPPAIYNAIYNAATNLPNVVFLTEELMIEKIRASKPIILPQPELFLDLVATFGMASLPFVRVVSGEIKEISKKLCIVNEDWINMCPRSAARFVDPLYQKDCIEKVTTMSKCLLLELAINELRQTKEILAQNVTDQQLLFVKWFWRTWNTIDPYSSVKITAPLFLLVDGTLTSSQEVNKEREFHALLSNLGFRIADPEINYPDCFVTEFSWVGFPQKLQSKVKEVSKLCPEHRHQLLYILCKDFPTNAKSLLTILPLLETHRPLTLQLLCLKFLWQSGVEEDMPTLACPQDIIKLYTEYRRQAFTTWSPKVQYLTVHDVDLKISDSLNNTCYLRPPKFQSIQLIYTLLKIEKLDEWTYFRQCIAPKIPKKGDQAKESKAMTPSFLPASEVISRVDHLLALPEDQLENKWKNLKDLCFIETTSATTGLVAATSLYDPTNFVFQVAKNPSDFPRRQTKDWLRMLKSLGMQCTITEDVLVEAAIYLKDNPNSDNTESLKKVFEAFKTYFEELKQSERQSLVEKLENKVFIPVVLPEGNKEGWQWSAPNKCVFPSSRALVSTTMPIIHAFFVEELSFLKKYQEIPAPKVIEHMSNLLSVPNSTSDIFSCLYYFEEKKNDKMPELAHLSFIQLASGEYVSPSQIIISSSRESFPPWFYPLPEKYREFRPLLATAVGLGPLAQKHVDFIFGKLAGAPILQEEQWSSLLSILRSVNDVSYEYLPDTNKILLPVKELVFDDGSYPHLDLSSISVLHPDCAIALRSQQHGLEKLIDVIEKIPRTAISTVGVYADLTQRIQSPKFREAITFILSHYKILRVSPPNFLSLFSVHATNNRSMYQYLHKKTRIAFMERAQETTQSWKTLTTVNRGENTIFIVEPLPVAITKEEILAYQLQELLELQNYPVGLLLYSLLRCAEEYVMEKCKLTLVT